MSLYFESHVTIEPVSDERLELFKKTCKVYGFCVAELLMKKQNGELEKSQYDSFCTTRSGTYDEIKIRTLMLVQTLINEGFMVWRYKIEDTILDSRIDDSLFKLRHA